MAIIALSFVVSPQISRSADLQRSLTITTLIFAVVGVALYVFLFATSRETVQRDTTPVSLSQTLGAIRHNRPLLLLCLSALSFLTGMFILQTLQVYYARDVLGNADYIIVLASRFGASARPRDTTMETQPGRIKSSHVAARPRQRFLAEGACRRLGTPHG